MLDYLKKGTRKLHQEVERYSLARYAMDRTITLDGYKKLLLQNYCSYSLIEQELIRNCQKLRATLQPFVSDIKSKALCLDLTALHMSCKMTDGKDMPFVLNSEAEAIGALYVIEGSMLGGMVIFKGLNQCPDLREIEKHHFFEQNAKLVSRRWKQFCNTLDSIEFTGNERKAALSGACNTFRVFQKSQALLNADCVIKESMSLGH